MICRTIAALLCTLVLFREADCRLHHRHHYRDEDHPHRAKDHLTPDENHQRLSFDRHHQDHQRLSGEDHHRPDSDHQRLGVDDHHRPDSDHQRLGGEDHHRPDSDHHLLSGEDHHHHRPSDSSEAKQRRDELLALEHIERVTGSITCSVPRPQVVHVSDHHPGRYFLPHCTVLHRCGRHSGCCGADQLRCAAVEKARVALPFFAVREEDIRPGGRAVRRVEWLEFTNHTRCGCEAIAAGEDL